MHKYFFVCMCYWSWKLSLPSHRCGWWQNETSHCFGRCCNCSGLTPRKTSKQMPFQKFWQVHCEKRVDLSFFSGAFTVHVDGGKCYLSVCIVAALQLPCRFCKIDSDISKKNNTIATRPEYESSVGLRVPPWTPLLRVDPQRRTKSENVGGKPRPRKLAGF